MEQKLTSGLVGAGIGALALAILGFTWGGWMTNNAAQVMSRQAAYAATVKALSPICVANFERAADAQAQLVAFKKIGYAWEREKFVREGKWAITTGSEPAIGVVDACADALNKL
jgi:hypothetical protein